jgi:eukaryotic-like serine/threonine-protein kinase
MSLPSDSKSSDSWTSFKGSSQRTGTTSSAFLRKPTFKTVIELGPILSSPVSDNASVYVCTITGRIYRIEISSALTKWHINTSSPIVSTPSISKGLLIVGTFSNWVGDAAVDIKHSNVCAFDIQDASEIWKFKLQKGVFSSICSIHDIHVFGCLDGKIYAINNEGDVRWQFTTGSEVWCSPSSDGNRVFVGSDDCMLYALDLDGKMIWKTELNGKIRSSSPCLSNDNDDDCDDLEFPSVYIGTQSGNLYRINKDNGAILWSAHLESPLLSSPSKIHQHILVGTSDGHLHCVRSTNGSSIWKYKTAGKIWSSPLLTRGLKVFVGSLDSHIYYLDILSGQLLWKFPTMDMIDSSPCLAGEMLIVGSRDGYLYFFDQGDMISYIW